MGMGETLFNRIYRLPPTGNKGKQYPFQYSGVVGLAVNVSNIFFDFRYEVGLHNTIRSITYNTDLTEAPHNEGEIKLEQRKNILSFSVGVIF